MPIFNYFLFWHLLLSTLIYENKLVVCNVTRVKDITHNSQLEDSYIISNVNAIQNIDNGKKRVKKHLRHPETKKEDGIDLMFNDLIYDDVYIDNVQLIEEKPKKENAREKLDKEKTKVKKINGDDLNNEEHEEFEEDKERNTTTSSTKDKQNANCVTKYKLVDKLKNAAIIFRIIEGSKVMTKIGPCIFESYDAFSVTVRDTNNIWDVVAILYGFIPYMLLILLIITYLITFNKNILHLLIMMVIVFLSVEYIWKMVFQMERPINSALKSYGMPSGHSTYAATNILMMTYFAIENHDWWSYIALNLSLLLFLPVPWSRIQLGDHTSSQVWWGCAIGAIYGLLFILHKEHMRYK